jgi:hypothetical protein
MQERSTQGITSYIVLIHQLAFGMDESNNSIYVMLQSRAYIIHPCDDNGKAFKEAMLIDCGHDHKTCAVDNETRARDDSTG